MKAVDPQRPHLRHGHVVGVGDPVLETLDHPPLVLQREGVGDGDLHLEDADDHGGVRMNSEG